MDAGKKAFVLWDTEWWEPIEPEATAAIAQGCKEDAIGQMKTTWRAKKAKEPERKLDSTSF